MTRYNVDTTSVAMMICSRLLDAFLLFSMWCLDRITRCPRLLCVYCAASGCRRCVFVYFTPSSVVVDVSASPTPPTQMSTFVVCLVTMLTDARTISAIYSYRVGLVNGWGPQAAALIMRMRVPRRQCACIESKDRTNIFSNSNLKRCAFKWLEIRLKGFWIWYDTRLSFFLCVLKVSRQDNYFYMLCISLITIDQFFQTWKRRHVGNWLHSWDHQAIWFQACTHSVFFKSRSELTLFNGRFHPQSRSELTLFRGCFWPKSRSELTRFSRPFLP